MNHDIKHSWNELNTPFVWVIGLLALIGLINLYSASMIFGQDAPSRLFYSQLMWTGLGIFLCLLVWRYEYQQLERIAYPFYLLSLLALGAVLIWGKEISGHQSWLKVGPFQFQPSEFAKIAYLLAFGKYLIHHEPAHAYRLRDLFGPLLLLIFPLTLVALQGDLGSALFFVLIFISLILFIGVSKKTFAVLISVGLSLMLVAYFFLLSPYQQQRLQTFLQPDLDPRGHGYQVIQSKIAVGSGQLWGKGYMAGMQNKLQYLPEKHKVLRVSASKSSKAS